jgi:hypothetical protein
MLFDEIVVFIEIAYMLRGKGVEFFTLNLAIRKAIGMTEVVRCSNILVPRYQYTRHHIPEGRNNSVSGLEPGRHRCRHCHSKYKKLKKEK